MIQEFYDKLYIQLQEELTGIAGSGLTPLAGFAADMEAIRIAIIRLNEEIILHPFSSSREEVCFFKSIKPKFYALKIYHKELFNIQQNTPFGGQEALKPYYQDEIIHIRHWFSRHKFYYQYYRLGATEFDDRYFLRSAQLPEIWLDDLPEYNKGSDSPLDGLFAKFMAYEMLQAHIFELMNNPGHKDVSRISPEVKWTGDKVNLVEVIYGIYHTGQLNNGNAVLSTIIRTMETSFQIDLSRTYRDFVDIKRRKASSPTRYLELMRESLHKHIDSENEYKPENGAGQFKKAWE